jgi:hypothetical protein
MAITQVYDNDCAIKKSANKRILYSFVKVQIVTTLHQKLPPQPHEVVHRRDWQGF